MKLNDGVRQSIAYGVTLLSCMACSDVSTAAATKVVPQAVKSRFLTDAAAASVDANGRFLLPSGGANGSGEINADAAKSLAMAAWRSAIVNLATYAKDRGAPIHAAELVPCERAFYIESAYTHWPQSAPLVVQKTLASQWLVGLCYGSVEEVAVSVSALASDARLAAEGKTLAAAGVANFFVVGVPVGVEIPMAPELVANSVAEATGKRVSSVPRLVMRPRPAAAQIAVWQVNLEAPVSVFGRDSHINRSRQMLYAGALNGWKEPAIADANPALVSDGGNEVVAVTHRNVQGGVRDYPVTRRSDVPAGLELISLGGR